MQNDVGRLFAMPSALVLSDLLADNAANPPFEVLEQAGFRRSDLDGYLARRADRMARCTAPTCMGK